MNNVKVFVLMAGMTALFGAIGAAVGGQNGMVGHARKFNTRGGI